MELQITEARESDIPGMVSLLEQLFSLEEDFSFNAENHSRALQRLIERNSGEVLVLVARDGTGFIAGMLTVQTVVSTAIGALSGWVEDVVVDRSCRGRGVGVSLLKRAEDWAAGNGIGRLQLLADRDNTPALNFYASRGWEGSHMIHRKKMIRR